MVGKISGKHRFSRIAAALGGKIKKEKTMRIPDSRVDLAYRWTAWFMGTNMTETGTVYAKSFFAACDRAVECAVVRHQSIPLRAIKVVIE